MTHVARYSIIRFLPYAETEEFANVGIVMVAPTARFLDFQLSNKWRRLSGFFDKLIEKAVRGVLRREGLGDRFQSAKLGVDSLQFRVPFAQLDADGKALRVIKPMHLAHEDPLRILDHGNQWLGRLRHLERVNAMPKSMLLAVAQPPADTDRFGAFEEVRRDLANMGAEFAASNDEQALLRFAQAA